MKLIKILNIVLIILILFFTLKIFFNQVNNNPIYSPNPREYLCKFNDGRYSSYISDDRCCYDLEKVSNCFNITSQNGFDFKCSNSYDAETFYFVDNKIFSLCKQEGYNVKVEIK